MHISFATNGKACAFFICIFMELIIASHGFLSTPGLMLVKSSSARTGYCQSEKMEARLAHQTQNGMVATLAHYASAGRARTVVRRTQHTFRARSYRTLRV